MSLCIKKVWVFRVCEVVAAQVPYNIGSSSSLLPGLSIDYVYLDDHKVWIL